MSYQVRMLVMSSGERLPILCSADGQPLGSPLIYALTEVRTRGRSSATIRHAMEAIKVLSMTLDRLNICLDARLKQGAYLQMQELDLIVRDASQKVRTSQSTQADAVCQATIANRLHYMLQYLRWYAYRYLLCVDVQAQSYLVLRDRVDKACAALKARAPCQSVRSAIDQRQGLSEEQVETVRAIADGRNDKEIWTNAHVRARGSLMLGWLLELGLRRGELLGVRTSDIDFQKGIVRISRRADSRKDPRAQQPLVKTRARDLLMSDGLLDATYVYILNMRRNQGNAAKHEYLFVANGSGKPLSLSGLNKSFRDLRDFQGGLPSDFSPHVLRHTWNDIFSQQMERAGMSPEMEKKMRSMLMGWSPTSETASTYTRRHVRKKAAQAMKSMQDRFSLDKEAK